MATRHLQSKATGAVLRASPQPQQLNDELGPLSELVGTWMGTGWNLIAVPDKTRQKPFLLLRAPVIETLTVAPLGGAVPNRGDSETQLIFGVQYEQRISSAVDNKPLHVENGMWLLVDGQDGLIARQSSVPHGDAILALGSAFHVDGPPPIAPVNSLPFPVGQPDQRIDDPKGYAAPYFEPVPGFNSLNPNEFLLKTLDAQHVVSTVTLLVSTKKAGAVTNIPFLVKNANPTSLESIFWIETVEDRDTGAQFQQLQYTQTVNLEFPPSDRPDPSKPEPMVVWPHISVATLVKQ